MVFRRIPQQARAKKQRREGQAVQEGERRRDEEEKKVWRFDPAGVRSVLGVRGRGEVQMHLPHHCSLRTASLPNPIDPSGRSGPRRGRKAEAMSPASSEAQASQHQSPSLQRGAAATAVSGIEPACFPHHLPRFAHNRSSRSLHHLRASSTASSTRPFPYKLHVFGTISHRPAKESLVRRWTRSATSSSPPPVH